MSIIRPRDVDTNGLQSLYDQVRVLDPLPVFLASYLTPEGERRNANENKDVPAATATYCFPLTE